MKIGFLSLALILMLAIHVHSDAFNLLKIDKHGSTLQVALCNKDTVLDFYLSPETTISCTNAGCTVIKPESSLIRFLDVGGTEETYTLQNTQTKIYKIDGAKTRSNEQGMIKLALLSDSGKMLYIGIPFSQSILANSSTDLKYDIDLTKIGDNAFNTIKTATNLSTQSLPLSSLNFLNRREFGHFYHLANNAQNPTITYLLSYFILSNSQITINDLSLETYNFPVNSPTFNLTDDTYTSTGDKICWGSGVEGIFQTHLRQSYPLWTAWLGIFFYWIYNLITESNQINCYDKKFQDNKWTCWGFYSLNRLGHEEYFTKLSRSTLMLITFSWYGCVLSILYYQVPSGKDSVMILWAAVIAVFTGMPFTYSMGYIFLNKIYELTLKKYETLKKMKGVFNKKDSSMDIYEKLIDDTEETLYGYYYWYYVLAFCFFTAFWVIAVHEMMQVHRDYYYFMYYWLASIGVALGLEHLFLDPIMSFLFGNMNFYRIRGFYYDFRLGAAFKEIEE